MTDNKQTLNARIAILVLALLSILEIVFKLTLTISLEGMILPSALLSEFLWILPKLLLILYAAGLYRAEKARILPFLLLMILTALNAFHFMGAIADYLQMLARGEGAFGETGRAFLQSLVLSALSALSCLLLGLGCWKSFSKPIFSILPLAILALCVLLPLGYNGFFAVKPLIERATNPEMPAYGGNTYILATFASLSNLFFWIAIGLFALKNRNFSIRTAEPVSAEKAD